MGELRFFIELQFGLAGSNLAQNCPSYESIKKILLAVACAVSLAIAVIWLLLFGRGYSFHFAGIYFTSGILVLIGMLIVDGLIFFALSRKSK